MAAYVLHRDSGSLLSPAVHSRVTSRMFITRRNAIERIPPPHRIEFGEVSLMHGKCVTYLQLENESETSDVTGNFVASLLLTDW